MVCIIHFSRAEERRLLLMKFLTQVDFLSKITSGTFVDR